MMKAISEIHFLLLKTLLLCFLVSSDINATDFIKTKAPIEHNTPKLVYIVSDIRIPFWKTMSKGVKRYADLFGYQLEVLSSHNEAKRELKHVIKAIHENVSGIIISPTTSAAGAIILKLAKKASIPVVISDIGADSRDYISYISSNNKRGAYDLGLTLSKKMKQLNIDKPKVGIIAIPQKRANGRARTTGFMQAMDESNIQTVGIYQQVTFSYQETYDFSIELIHKNPDLSAIWLQGSDRYQAALDAINKLKKQKKILLICFDFELAFLELIPQGIITNAAVQQPYLMGKEAVDAMNAHLRGKNVLKEYIIPILIISPENINEHLDTIKKNVLGIELMRSNHNVKD